MASYFVACHDSPGEVEVHDRQRCPPGCFMLETTTEYLGEFLDARQAVAVARLRYADAQGCSCCCGTPAARQQAGLLQPLDPS